MKRAMATGALAVGLMLGSAGAASADSGNHGAIWKADQHMSLSSGSEWGALISSIDRKPCGVSEGVHLAKKGWNKVCPS